MTTTFHLMAFWTFSFVSETDNRAEPTDWPHQIQRTTIGAQQQTLEPSDIICFEIVIYHNIVSDWNHICAVSCNEWRLKSVGLKKLTLPKVNYCVASWKLSVDGDCWIMRGLMIFTDRVLVGKREGKWRSREGGCRTTWTGVTWSSWETSDGVLWTW